MTTTTTTTTTPQILDPCCGGRMMWFNKDDPRAMFCDIRAEEHVLCDGRVFAVSPDTVADFRALPFTATPATNRFGGGIA